MAQYDLFLSQNVHASGIEFSEKIVNIGKGDLLSGVATTKVPTVLAAGTNGYMLVRDDNEATGLKWIAIAAGHTQNTDTGTTGSSFAIDSDGYDVDIVAESAAKIGLKVHAGTYADLQAKDGTFNTVTVGSAAPTGAYELTHKTYVDGLLAANDAMIFKGTVGTGGTHEIAAFNSLATYNAGWTYRAITAGTIKGKVCEIGDMIIALVDRAGSSNVDGDWTVVQTNIDGAVVGPASVSDGYLVLFDGVTGKLIKAGTGAPGSMAYATATDYIAKALVTEQGDIIYASAASTPAALAHGTDGQVLKSGGHGANPSWLTLGTMAAAATGDYVAKALYDANSILYATTDDTPAALTIGASTIVGRKASGNIVALTAAETMGILWQTAPAAKNSTGTSGWMAKDDNFLYLCTATDTWHRVPIATNW